MRILFWNTNKKSFIDDIIKLTYDNDVDFLILAESGLSVNKIANDISAFTNKRFFGLDFINNDKFKIITRLNPEIIQNFDSEFGSQSWTINKINFPNDTSLNIIAVHLPSKLYWDDISQSFEAVNLMSNIRNFEKQNNKNTIVIGDFNMNPFETGMVSSIALNSVGNKDVAKLNGRIVLNQFYDYFYNPMWNFYNSQDNVSFTYRYDKSTHYAFKLNIFDQILIRPQLFDYFDDNDIEIINKIGNIKLLNKNITKVNYKDYDHLPILININFNI